LPAAQPYRAHLKDMMERQAYPRRLNPDGTAEPPYDVAGWTLPLMMGVRAAAVAKPFSAKTERLERVEPCRGWIEGKVQDARCFLIANRANDDFIVLNALLEAGVAVDVLGGDDRGSEWYGALSFPADATARRVLDRVLPAVSTKVKAMAESPPSLSRRRLTAPAPIALYQPWMPSMDEGWTRLVLENHGFKYTTVHNADVRAGNLIERFRVLLVPSISPRTLRDGFAENETEPAYVGGLGAEGAETLCEFLRAGGTLVCLADSTDYAIDELNLPVKNVLKGLKSSAFYSPGSILRAQRQAGADGMLAIGVPRELSVYFDNGQAFEVDGNALNRGQASVVLSYDEKQPLESGWLVGPDKIEGKAALVALDVLGGRVILFGFSPQHRGQTHGTFRLLFNSLLAETQGGLSRATSN
jgi:hypothetical protein